MLICVNIKCQLKNPLPTGVHAKNYNIEIETVNRIWNMGTNKYLVKANTKLSDYKHNMESFRYCMIDVPGDSREDIMEKYVRIQAMLGYEFTNELKKTS